MDVRRVLIGLMAALFTVMISGTIVATALPTISAELRGTPTQSTWVLAAALLTNAVSTPIWGKLSDLHSKKLLIQVAIVLFIVSTTVSALAPTMGVLVAARAVQGLPVGGVLALIQSILASLIPARQRGRYAGYIGSAIALATSVGPLAGGLIVDSPLGWRWCYWVCLPLAVLALVLLRSMPTLRTAQQNVSIDWLGTGLLTSGMSLLLIWVSFAGRPGFFAWLSPATARMVGVGVLLLAAFVVVETRARQPIIPLSILRERTTVLAVLGTLAGGFAVFASIPLLSQYLQVGRHQPATTAGLLLLPMVLGSFLGSLVSGRLISKYGRWKPYIVVGSVALAVGLAALGFLDHTTALWHFGIMITVLGVGSGMLTQNVPLAVQNTVELRNVGAASATVQFFRSLSGAVTLAVFSSIVNSTVAQRVRGGSTVGVAFGDSVGVVFLLAAALGLIGVVAIALIKHRDLRETVQASGERTLEALAKE